VLSDTRLRAGLASATARLAAVVAVTDEATRVPSCPDWSLRQLTGHVGRVHRWAGEIVNRRSAGMLDFREAPDGKLPGALADRADWLTAGADRFAAAVDGAAGEQMWTWLGPGPAGYWLRRMAHETGVHAADAELAVGSLTPMDADLAADALDEMLGFATALRSGGPVPALEPGATLHLHATDDGLDGAGEWLITVLPAGIGVRPGHQKADIALRGPAATLLLVLTRRLAPDQPGVDVLGDAALLTPWLEVTRL